MNVGRMKMNKSGGIGFFGLLGILFIALKLTGYIAWSWWLVLLPLYLPFAVAVSLFAIGFGLLMFGKR